MFDGVGEWLFPEPESHEAPKTFRWRQVVSLAIFLLGLSVIAGNALAWGFVPFLFSGFASSNQVHTVWESQIEIRASQVERSILEARERQCHAQAEGNMEVLQFATQRLSDAMADWQRATKREYRIPECNELVIGK